MQHRRYENFKDDPEQAGQELLERIQPTKSFELEMVHIPAGEFLMGSIPGLDQASRSDEYPQHPLYLPDYHMARTPVTRAQYGLFVQATGY